MTTYADMDALADQLGARRRRAEQAAPPILLALGLRPSDGAPGEAAGPADLPPAAARASAGVADVSPQAPRDTAPSAPARATAQLLATAFDDLGQAEEELRVQNEALFAARTELEAEQRAVLDLFELAPVAYVVTTADGRMLRMNHAAFARLGRPANFAVGKPLAVYTAVEDRAAFRAALARASASPHIETWRVRLVPRDGEALECRVRVRAVAARAAGPRAPALDWVITPELSDPAGDID